MREAQLTPAIPWYAPFLSPLHVINFYAGIFPYVLCVCPLPSVGLVEVHVTQSLDDTHLATRDSYVRPTPVELLSHPFLADIP